MAQESRKTELIAELARARQTMSSNLGALRHDLNFVARIEAAFRRHRVAWLTGAALLGFILAKLPPRTKKVVVDRKGRAGGAEKTFLEAGLLVTILKFAFDIARPALTKWLRHRVADYAADR